MKKSKLLTLALVATLTIASITGCNKKVKTGNESKDMITVGISQIAPHGSLDNCREGFIKGMEEAGFVEGENVKYDYQNAGGEPSNAAMISDTFVSDNYDLICAIATPTAVAAFNAAIDSKIPVVFTAVSDPVSAEIVRSLDKPETNCTGTADLLPLEEQMKLIRDMMPEAKTIGILYTLTEVNSETHLKTFKKLAPQYGFKIEAIGVNSSADIPLAVDELLTKVDCINNFTDNNVVNNLDTVLAKANEAGIPVFGSEEEQVKKGCVAARNIDYVELGRQTGLMAAEILNGADPSTMAVKLISDSKPVANKEAMEKFNLTMPSQYENEVTYLTAE